jgi:NAD(P)-dependent dehydrogenase (short-subunit alcohol dehydrogenase family)
MIPSLWKALEGAKLVKEKIVLITGAADGIGKACAHMFAHQGGKLALADMQEEKLEKVCREIQSRGGEALPIRADVTDEKELDRIFQMLLNTYRGLDILVNNAGGGLPTDFFAISLKEWNQILSINLTSVFLISQRAADLFRKRKGGAIVNLSSQAGRSVSPTAGVHYTASKAGLLGLTRHLAKILAPDHIRVNAVCPGMINSARIVARLVEKGSLEKAEQSIPLGRIGDVEEVAGCCLFLASDLAGYVTGAALDVNGGALMI